MEPIGRGDMDHIDVGRTEQILVIGKGQGNVVLLAASSTRSGKSLNAVTCTPSRRSASMCTGPMNPVPITPARNWLSPRSAVDVDMGNGYSPGRYRVKPISISGIDALRFCPYPSNPIFNYDSTAFDFSR